ncbi:hypothetical protein KL86SPO_20397 [uncultured Sporomusa sp.]|uniref:GP-PDE domain-containing protein n=1 Tax=uncultured Sporomusa sp. TaxID=307249 RepID=A0A212LNJ5_9FIRM|nr:hypothetical protein KL86SPO_20397 [uncultured Sporomusa sp.]
MSIAEELLPRITAFEHEHPYLENTIASMEAAFQAGADIVELDVHITKDG